MKLNIKNFAKIKEADIIVDGITVIAGENNTGKSTVGKILFSLFNVLSDIDEKICDERLKEVETTNLNIILNYISSLDISRSTIYRIAINIAKRINSQLRQKLDPNSKIQDEVISEIIRSAIEGEGRALKAAVEYASSEMIEELYKNIKEILNLPEEKIVKECISIYFKNVFCSQIQSLSNKDSEEAILTLDIKGKKEQIYFANNYCRDFIGEINIIHKAIYIDNPFVVDELSEYNELNLMNEFLKDLLHDSYKEGAFDGVVETVRTKEKLDNVYGMVQNIVDGEIIVDQKEEFYLKDNNYDEPISIHNLSTGMKSFVILKMLLEKGSIKNKDVLILDEPEIHLHPQWQIAYAELIVLLQKQFDLSVVVTTHSPYFVDAINLFSCKYETDKKVNYYLSSGNGTNVTMEPVTKKIDLIYKKMASPIQMLDTLRYELNNK